MATKSGVSCTCPCCGEENLISNFDYCKPGNSVQYFCGPQCLVPYLESRLPRLQPFEAFTLAGGIIRIQDKPKSWLPPHWLRLAGELLDRAADEFGNHGCNDWDWPKDMTVEQRRQLADEIVAHDAGKRPTDLSLQECQTVEAMVENGPPDHWLMRFLGQRLIQAGKEGE